MIDNGEDVTQVNTSQITDMSNLFLFNSTFNQDISSWDVGKVTHMGLMFNYALVFNADLSEWDVGNVTDMDSMFFKAATFNQDLSGWNTCKVTSSTDFSTGATAWTMPMPNFPCNSATNTEEEDKASVFALEQNYPNPFNPSTVINYSVANRGEVSLSVYNLLGQKVAQLVNGTKAAGSYNVTWNATAAASGMYYYRLEAGGQVLTQKMMSIK